ncbi:MAG: type II toxin-antitoxin system RelE family toxin [Thermomicrobiales bacterium]
MKWQWILTPAAEKQLDRLDPDLRDRVIRRLDVISEDIRHPSIRKLQGGESYRLRIGDHRVIFQIDGGNQTIVVTKIGDRKDVYR